MALLIKFIKNFSTLVLILFTFINAFSQDKAIISGKIVENDTKESIPFVTVVLSAMADSSVVNGALSDNNGRFTLSGIAPGNYHIFCSFLGFETKSVSILVGKLNDVYDVGKIELISQTWQLDDVLIHAKKEVVSSGLEKKVYNLEDNFSQAGGSILDALKALPGVTVEQDGKVLLRGSDKVVILMDGKQSSLTGFGNQKGLDNIPTANVAEIEIINNPSAKYDAIGMAGIINIIYKKEKSIGFNGDVGLTLGLGQLSKRKADLPTDLGSYSINPKVVPSLNLNYRNQKINAFIQSEILFQHGLPNNEFTTRTYEDGTVIKSQVPENRKQIHYIVNGGIDWFINESNTITFSSIFDYEHHTDTAQVPYIDVNNSERERYWAWSESEVTGFLNFRLDHKYKFEEPGHELNSSLQYTQGWEDETYFLNDSSSIRQSRDTTHILATEHTIPFTVDYVKPLASGRLETGVKMQIRRIPVTYTVGRGEQSVIYPGLGDWSEWGENLYGGYVNYVFEKPKFDFEGGLRLEQTDVFYNISSENIYYLENDAYDYFKVYPNIRLSYRLNEQNSLSAFYNRRVDRPGEPELRIFPKYDDPELLKVGNPYLRPQFSQTFELSYMRQWTSGSLYLSTYYRIIDDHFTRIYSIDSSNAEYDIINKIYQNVGRATNAGVELLFSQNIRDFLKLSASFNLYNNIIDAHEGILLFPYQRPFSIGRSQETTWDVKLNNQFILPKQTQIQLTYIFYAPKNIPQGRQLARSSLDLGVKKVIFKDKAEIVFSFSDILNHFGIRQEIKGEGFSALYENYYETQVIRLGMKYKF